MSLWPLLLRIVLIVAVAFNGVAVAAVGSPMPMQHGEAQASAPEPGKMSHSAGCHETMAAALSQHEAPAGDLPEKPSKDSGDADCCKSGTCRCPGMQVTSWAVSVWTTEVAISHVSPPVQSMSLDYPAPVPGLLIRPPIG